MVKPEAESPAWLTARRATLAVALLTLIGLVPRLIHFDETLLGDELSTLWVVRDRSFSDMLHTVASDAEISPPLYFIFAWLATKLSSAPELIRLPALIAGTVSIPLTYLVGARALNRLAGVFAAAVLAVSPFMIFYSADARVYALAIMLLLGSTLAMLIAVRGGGTRWWVAYAALSCLAMYSHYTSAFVLLAQLLWLFWAYPHSWKPALFANVGAAIFFLPWVPSMLNDLNSPTIKILDALQGSGFTVKRTAVEVWAFGYPGADPAEVPGRAVMVVLILGLAVAAIAGLVRFWPTRSEPAGAPLRDRVSKGIVLVLLLALATPVAEAAILLLGGTDLFGARNLNTSSGGLALAIGGVLAAAGPLLGPICAAVVIGCFAIAATKTLADDVSTINFKAAAGFIEANAQPGDVVLDTMSSSVSPVPLTPLDAHLPQTHPEFRLYLPTGPPPFLEPPPAPKPLFREAVREAEGNRLFIVTRDGSVGGSPEAPTITITPPNPNVGTPEVFKLPPGSSILDQRHYDGIGGVNVVVVQPGDIVSPDMSHDSTKAHG